MDKEITNKIKEKIKSLSTKQKQYIYLRALMIEKNKQLSSLLHKKLTNVQYTTIKAELLHFLYDGNTNNGNSYRYNKLLRFFQNKQNIYDLMDNYTLCSYILFYDIFIKTSFNATNYKQIKRATNCAYYKISNFIEKNKIDFENFNDTNINLQTYLKSEYRNSMLNFLKKELKIKNNMDLINFYLQTDFNFMLEDDINENIFKQKVQFSNMLNDKSKIYANQVEEYVDENGHSYYLDHEGNYIEIEEIKDFVYKNQIIKATNKGLKTMYAQNEELTK